jgi:hypothetical protein
MKTILILILITLLVSCGQTQDKSNGRNKGSYTNQQTIQVSERITINGLQNALIKLQNGKTEYKFIGITSNGIDCVYFVFENGKFNLEFEAMGTAQLPYINKVKEFAHSNNFKWMMTTYNNKPQYKSDKPAPVLRIETNSSLDEIIRLGEKLQSEIFENNNETVYDVVP